MNETVESEIAKFIETKSIMVVATKLGAGGNGEMLESVQSFSYSR